MSTRPSNPKPDASRPIPYGRQDVGQDEIDEVTRCLRGDWLTQGPRLERFEGALREVTGARYAVAVSSGTAALHVSHLALGIGPGDTGLTSPITFLASANATCYAGGEICFSDVEPDSGLMDPAALDRTLALMASAGRRVGLVVPVHLAGQPVDMPRVAEIAARHGARVVEDAAHALGGAYLGPDGARHPVGQCAHAEAAVFSFHPVKQITTAEGGAVTTNDRALARRLRAFREHGIYRDENRRPPPDDDPMSGPWTYEQQELGFNYRLSDLHCALGLAQLARLDAFVARRKALAARYDAALSAPPLREALRPLRRRRGGESSFHLYVVQLIAGPSEEAVDVARRRADLYRHLRDHDIGAQVHYIPVSWQPYHRARLLDAQPPLPGAEAYYAASITLPLFPAMTDGDQERVIDVVQRWALGVTPRRPG